MAREASLKRRINTLAEYSAPLEWDQSTLEGWFNYFASRLASELKHNGLNVNRYPFKPFILSHNHKAVPEYFRNQLYSMGVEWITARPGEEANYIVFLTRDMEKFHELYLAT